jgi:hypothetical protein
MNRHPSRFVLLFFVLLSLCYQLPANGQTPALPATTAAIQAPVLKWQRGRLLRLLVRNRLVFLARRR